MCAMGVSTPFRYERDRGTVGKNKSAEGNAAKHNGYADQGRKGSCIRISKAISADKTIKPIGATGNHQRSHRLAQSEKRGSGQGQKENRRKDDVRQHAIEGAKEKHGQRKPGLQKYGIGRCAEAGMQLSE